MRDLQILRAIFANYKLTAGEPALGRIEQIYFLTYLPTTGSSNDVVWRMFIVYIYERKLTSGILCNFNRCKWEG